MQNYDDFTHFNDEGRARMVNVGDKAETVRTASAGARNRGVKYVLHSALSTTIGRKEFRRKTIISF